MLGHKALFDYAMRSGISLPNAFDATTAMRRSVLPYDAGPLDLKMKGSIGLPVWVR